jgi:hypothetical protein
MSKLQSTGHVPITFTLVTLSFVFFGGPAAQAGTGAAHEDKADLRPIIMNNWIPALIADAHSNVTPIKTGLSLNGKIQPATALCAMEGKIIMPVTKSGTPKSGPIVAPKKNNTEKVEKNHIPK